MNCEIGGCEVFRAFEVAIDKVENPESKSRSKNRLLNGLLQLYILIHPPPLSLVPNITYGYNHGKRSQLRS
jgi:hypothetical protein